MRPIDITPLRDTIRSIAKELYGRGVVAPDEAIRLLHGRHSETLTQELIEYGFGIWMRDEVKIALKEIGKQADRINGYRQFILPLAMERLSIPSSLQVKREGKPAWVATVDGTRDDGDQYVRVLQGNVNACLANLTDFLEMWRHVKPLLELHENWRIGDALDYLRSQEQSAA